jgi:cytochrome c
MKVAAVVLIVLFWLQENNPPSVKINLPKASQNFTVGSAIRYSISVADKEDGDTRFDEIDPNRILLEVRTGKGTKSSDELHAMMASNCMNCHAFKSKLIGPSFFDISTKKSNSAELIKHVKEGSKGVWGDIVMPSHPELTNQEIEKMVEWILKYKDEKEVDYYLGKEGSFRVQKPSALTLVAGYLDHQKAKGEDKVVIQVK